MLIRSFILSVSGRGLPHIFLKHHGKVIRGAEAAAIGYFIDGIILFIQELTGQCHALITAIIAEGLSGQRCKNTAQITAADMNRFGDDG